MGEPYSEWFNHAKNFLFDNWKYNHERYFEDDDTKHKDFLCALLNEDSVELFSRAQIGFLFLKSFMDKTMDEKPSFITRKELRNIQYRLFQQYLEANPNDPKKTEAFYHLNDYKVVNNLVQVFPPVNRLYKKYLISNPVGFENYVKILLRQYQIPYDGRLAIEPYLMQIFPDLRVFVDKLFNTNFDDSNMNRLKDFILSFMKNNPDLLKKPFEIENDNDRVFVEQFLSLKRKAFSNFDNF